MIQNATPTAAPAAAPSGPAKPTPGADAPADGFSALLAAIFAGDPALLEPEADAGLPSDSELVDDGLASDAEREEQLRAAALAAAILAPLVQAALQGDAAPAAADAEATPGPVPAADLLAALGAPGGADAPQGPIAASGAGEFAAQAQADVPELAAAAASAAPGAGAEAGASERRAAPPSPAALARARSGPATTDPADAAVGAAPPSPLTRALHAAPDAAASGGGQSDSGERRAEPQAARAHAHTSGLRGGDAREARAAAGADPLAAVPLASFSGEAEPSGAPAATAVGPAQAAAHPSDAALAATASHATARAPAPASAGTPGGATGAPVAPESLPLHVEWLAERGGGTAVVDLHPPHLGRVEISVRVVGDEVEVSIASRDSQVQGVLDAQRGNLEQSLADRNLRMTLLDLGLSGSPDRGFANAPRDPQSDARERRAAEAGDAPRIPAATAAAATPASPRPARSQRGIDLHA